ncbi:16745_t:CDS:2, partial [Dentiscutata erythropus]
DGVYWIMTIARLTFSKSAVPTLTNTHNVFTLAISDILLNPWLKTTKCDDKRIKSRIECFLNNFKNSELFYQSAKSIASNEVACVKTKPEENDQLFRLTNRNRSS